jgi:membrane-bound serine protease (ClpP class)
MRRTGLLILLAGIVLAFPVGAWGQDAARVEVLEVRGIIDSSVERAVIATIEQAESERAVLVVLQIDSKGTVGDDRASRLTQAIRRSRVPVVSWVGPPGAIARNGAARLVAASHLPAVSPGSRVGPVETVDLRERQTVSTADFDPADAVRAASVSDLLEELNGKEVRVAERTVSLEVDPTETVIRFRKLDLPGRLLHAVAQPSIAYLLVLVGLVGIVFEVFHPSTGPAGVSGLAGLAFGLYGVATLGGSWLGVASMILGVAGFCVDLRYQGLGPFTVAGFAGLVAGSLLIFGGPYLRVDPWILAFGITSMVLFLLGAMTRVLRDLRAVARGEIEVRDPHPHPNGHGA